MFWVVGLWQTNTFFFMAQRFQYAWFVIYGNQWF